VPGGELDGVAAAIGEGVSDKVAGRGAGGLRRPPRCQYLPAKAAVVQGEEVVPVAPVLSCQSRCSVVGRIGGSRLDGLLMRLLRRLHALRLLLLRSRDLTGRLGRVEAAAAGGFP
jgi:hypothetical protein